ncbi:MAG: copper amine oxidase N-terminal domain-containing protein [Firmicutes bacterium]|nr:copper amine oxidase N-terminal domain-containing protein [Bacillota bacterium]
MLKKIFAVFLAFVFCLTMGMGSAAFGAGKTEKCRDYLVAGSSWKIPPGQLKKISKEDWQTYSGLNIQVKEKEKAKGKEKVEKKEAKDKIKKEIKLKVNGKPFFPDLPPVIKEGRTLIPVRAVINGLGASVEWDGEERKIIVSKGDITVELFIDEYVFYINGKKKELDVPAQLISNRTFVPLRFLALALNINVNYDEENDEVIIGDEILESFTIGGKDVLALEGVSVQSPGEAGATLKIDDFINFGNISIKPADEEASITVFLNGSVVEKEDLAAQAVEDGDVILAIVTTTRDNKTVTYYYKVTVRGIPSASFSFVGPYNLTETDRDVSGFAVTVKQVTNIEEDVKLRYLLKVAEGNLNGKVVQYGDPAEGIFIIEDGGAYFGPQAGFTLEELPQLKGATGITTPLTIKNGLSQGVYKFTVSLVDLDGNVLVSSGRFSIVVGL